MSRRRRTEGEVAGDREAQRAAATLGSDLKRTRSRRHLTQQQMSDRLGISRTRYSGIERGEGASAPLSVWFRAGVVLGTPFAVSFSRDTVAPLVDARPRGCPGARPSPGENTRSQRDVRTADSAVS
jgi:DNA-binding XRE family transcriptional regulator